MVSTATSITIVGSSLGALNSYLKPKNGFLEVEWFKSHKPLTGSMTLMKSIVKPLINTLEKVAFSGRKRAPSMYRSTPSPSLNGAFVN